MTATSARTSAVVEVDVPSRSLRTWTREIRRTPSVSFRMEYDPESPEEALTALSAAFADAARKILPEALRAAREAAWDAGYRHAAYPAPGPLPLHRTEAGGPSCSTCDGGGCPDCTDPA